jgi:hypothetical protein
LAFQRGHYDQETVELMTRAIEEAWREFEGNGGLAHERDLQAVHTAMVLRIMIAVKDGERDQARLKVLALNAIDGRAIE